MIETTLIQKWHEIITAQENSIIGFINSCKPVCYEYIGLKQQAPSNSFNVFSLVSDLYYRENFHSDIIRYFLDTKENHGCGNKFLSVFITMLNSLGRNLEVQNYNDAIAIREEGKIDILVRSDNSKRVIIIENKMNNAGDMPRQLPRYYDYVTQYYKNYQIDAIVYLPLNKGKSPDMSDWTDEDKSNIRPLLEIIPSYDKSQGVNLVDNWLHQSELIADKIDVLSTLRQYSQLIKILNLNIMDTVILEKFYNKIKEGDNFMAAKSIRSMLNDLPVYLTQRIQDKYGCKCHPFKKVWIYNSKDAVFEGAPVRGIELTMDIVCSDKDYKVQIWTRDDGADEETFNSIVSDTDSLSDFEVEANIKNRIIKFFDIMDEDGLYQLIESLQKELANLE